MPKSLYLDTVVLNAALRNIAFTPPVTVYVALYTTAPTLVGGGVEVSGGSYSRQPVAFNAPVGQVCASTADVVFPLATAGWGAVVAYALFDAPTGGNMLYFANLSSPRTVSTNDQLRFPLGQLTATEA